MRIRVAMMMAAAACAAGGWASPASAQLLFCDATRAAAAFEGLPGADRLVLVEPPAPLAPPARAPKATQIRLVAGETIEAAVRRLTRDQYLAVSEPDYWSRRAGPDAQRTDVWCAGATAPASVAASPGMASAGTASAGAATAPVAGAPAARAPVSGGAIAGGDVAGSPAAARASTGATGGAATPNAAAPPTPPADSAAPVIHWTWETASEAQQPDAIVQERDRATIKPTDRGTDAFRDGSNLTLRVIANGGRVSGITLYVTPRAYCSDDPSRPYSITMGGTNWYYRPGNGQATSQVGMDWIHGTLNGACSGRGAWVRSEIHAVADVAVQGFPETRYRREITIGW
jgi:hypothetical protein